MKSVTVAIGVSLQLVKHDGKCGARGPRVASARLYLGFTKRHRRSVNGALALALISKAAFAPSWRIFLSILRRAVRLASLAVLAATVTGCIVVPFGRGHHGGYGAAESRSHERGDPRGGDHRGGDDRGERAPRPGR